jgi:hypothetical protein
MEDIKAYLKDGTTKMMSNKVDKIILYVITSFNKIDNESLERLKNIYEERSDNGDYEGGSEMAGPNNFWAGNGPKYIAVSLFYDTTTHNIFISDNFKEDKYEAMIVLACEVFKNLCPDSSEEDKTWFIKNLAHVLSSFF